MTHCGELGDLINAGFVGVEQNRVLEVVGDAVGSGVGHITFHARDHLFALAGKGHVADGSDAASECSPGPNLEVVGPAVDTGPGYRRRQVHVRVNATGKHELVPGVDLDIGRHDTTELNDAAIGHAEIGHDWSTIDGDRAAFDHKIHGATLAGPIGGFHRPVARTP